ncbi:MAG TPA: hypothetical protein GXZ90_05435 [Clostridiales bacterium]|nr:hypothetical protein [Clostridiales bacterium]
MILDYNNRRLINISKFHINKNGIPSPCKAKPGNCPLGGEGEHFDSKEEAQNYSDNKNKSEYSILPEVLVPTNHFIEEEQEFKTEPFQDKNTSKDFKSVYAKRAIEALSEKVDGMVGNNPYYSKVFVKYNNLNSDFKDTVANNLNEFDEETLNNDKKLANKLSAMLIKTVEKSELKRSSKHTKYINDKLEARNSTSIVHREDFKKLNKLNELQNLHSKSLEEFEDKVSYRQALEREYNSRGRLANLLLPSRRSIGRHLYNAREDEKLNINERKETLDNLIKYAKENKLYYKQESVINENEDGTFTITNYKLDNLKKLADKQTKARDRHNEINVIKNNLENEYNSKGKLTNLIYPERRQLKDEVNIAKVRQQQAKANSTKANTVANNYSKKIKAEHQDTSRLNHEYSQSMTFYLSENPAKLNEIKDSIKYLKSI